MKVEGPPSFAIHDKTHLASFSSRLEDKVRYLSEGFWPSKREPLFHVVHETCDAAIPHLV